MRYHFANCRLDTDQYVLCRGGQPTRLRPKAFQILAYLLCHRDRVITKQELAEQFWPNQFITDAVVENTLKTVRRAIGDSGRAQTLIQTLRGVGYRVVAPVTADSETPTMGRPLQRRELPTAREPTPRLDVSSTRPPVLGAERRQLTVLVCRVVNSTALSRQMALEDYFAVIQMYHSACAEVIERLDGHLAQHLEDGFLAYFGYPRAHEDDAHRAIRAGLEIIDALKPLRRRLKQGVNARLAVRSGIHTGMVLIGEIGMGERRKFLALGETPRLATRLQRLTEPDTVAISEVTAGLVQDYDTLYERRGHMLQGDAADMPIFRVITPTCAQNRLAVADGLKSMVDREAECSLSLQH